MEFITLATPAEHMPAIDELRKVRLSTVLDCCARLLGLDVCGCGKLLFATTTWLRAPGAMSALLLCDWMLLHDVTTQTSSVIRLCLIQVVLRLHPDLKDKPLFWKRKASVLKVQAVF
jgi:hypothetical protein